MKEFCLIPIIVTPFLSSLMNPIVQPVYDENGYVRGFMQAEVKGPDPDSVMCIRRNMFVRCLPLESYAWVCLSKINTLDAQCIRMQTKIARFNLHTSINFILNKYINTPLNMCFISILSAIVYIGYVLFHAVFQRLLFGRDSHFRHRSRPVIKVYFTYAYMGYTRICNLHVIQMHIVYNDALENVMIYRLYS